MCDGRCEEGVGANYEPSHEPSHNPRRDLLKTQHCQRVPSGSRLGHGQAEGVSFRPPPAPHRRRGRPHGKGGDLQHPGPQGRRHQADYGEDCQKVTLWTVTRKEQGKDAKL